MGASKWHWVAALLIFGAALGTLRIAPMLPQPTIGGSPFQQGLMLGYGLAGFVLLIGAAVFFILRRFGFGGADDDEYRGE